ncbi:rab GTPase-binding effector protein 2-like isoform X2 [Mauremys mutica]|uniref:rab GTPase-binding effector protein 2-like isoform X2 n=1 Tax=Mauremys mutica TaxID=74926 RepID=UPI001D160E1A|nr:rab GTPase-binding effector protein 2-like isoform X2 [Mauremys mutica]
MEEPCRAEGLGGGAAAPQEPGVSVGAMGTEQPDPGGRIQALQEELAAALAEVETLRAVATVSEGTKQEAVAAVRRQCQEEVASLQAILRDTISSYEVRLEAVQQEQHGGGSWGVRELSRLQQQQTQGNPLDSLERQMEKGSLGGSSESLLSDAEAPSRMPPAHPGGEGDEGSGPEGEEEPGGGLAFARGCDSVSIISIASSSAGSPRPRRRPSPEHEDTASLLSTGTLVPESIYLPPPGFQLVPDGEWAQVQQEARRHQESLQQLEAATQEKLGLQEALRQSNEDCAKQVLVLLDQIQKSEQLLQNLQATVSQTQHRTQEQIADLASSHKRLSYEVQRLSEENEGLRGSRPPLTPTEEPPLPSSVQELQALVRRLQEEAGTLRRASEHHGERLRIEIVTLRERLDEEEAARARLQGVLEAQLGAQREESQLMEASLCSVRSEMERLQQQLGQAEQRAQGLEQDVQRLRGDLTQRDQQGQAWEQEKARLEAALSEQRGKLQRLQAELDTSEQVQRDFVRLSQTLQVQLERIRQAPSLEQVRSIVDGTRLKDVAELKEP